jgi:hypothetical protein
MQSILLEETKMAKSFWSDFVAGFAGPTAEEEHAPRRITGRALQEAKSEADDAFDTLKSLRDYDFWFDEGYKPLIQQLALLHTMGYLTTPPDVLKNGANIGHGRLLTQKATDFISMHE